MQIAWDLEEVSFVTVLWVVLTVLAKSIMDFNSSGDDTFCSVSPYICTFWFLSSKAWTLFLLFSKSYKSPKYISKKET